MRIVRAWFQRLGGLFARERHDRELAEEVESHLQFHIEDNVRAGMTPEEARRQALLKLGGIEQTKEKYRERLAVPWVEALIQDVRFGLRMLRRNPGFTATVVLTLALGIGANTAIFSLINAVVLRELPVSRPQELVLFSDSPGQGTASGDHGGHWTEFSSENYRYFSEHDKSFRELSAFQSGLDNLRIRLAEETGQPDSALGQLVSGNFFSFLGLNAAAGRLFSADDDRPGATPVAVLGYSYWTRKFNSDRSAIGKVIQVNGAAFTIIGVAPREFSGVGYSKQPNVWFPLAFQPQITSGQAYANDPKEYWLDIVGRLKPGVTLRRAQASVDVELRQIIAAQTNHPAKDAYIQLAPGAGGISYLRTEYSDALRLLMAIVALVLLIACANVVNLLLSRSAAREREISIRHAIGSSRGRLVRQLLTESMILAVLGGALGILIAAWSANFLASLVTGSSSAVRVSMDGRVLMFTASVSMAAGIVFGIVPALRASRVDLASRAKGPERTRGRWAFANGLVVFQIAACLTLLAGAGLFLRTLQKLVDQKLGFDEEHIVVARIDSEAAGYEPAQTLVVYRALIDRLEALPGVTSATVARSEPLSGDSSSGNFSIEGIPNRPDGEMEVHRELVGPRYFQTEGIPILLGRDIGPEDGPGVPLVVVINETMAQTFFRGANPIGKRFSFGAPFNEKEAMTIVGVAADARYYSLRDPVPPMEFGAVYQHPVPALRYSPYVRAVEVRVSGNPKAMASHIRTALAEAAADLPVTQVNVLTQEVSDSIRQNSIAAQLSTAFGVVALLLACIGLYGTMAYRVSRRTHEIGVRMALGARPGEILRMVLSEGGGMALTGVALGLVASLSLTRLMSSMLFGVSATDPLTFVVVAAILLAVALVACWIPARRAMWVDPMVALRYE